MSQNQNSKLYDLEERTFQFEKGPFSGAENYSQSRYLTSIDSSGSVVANYIDQ
jgi:hypothetical protein